MIPSVRVYDLKRGESPTRPEATMARRGDHKPKGKAGKTQFNLVCEPDWLARVEAEAARQAVTVSSYMRQAVSLKLEQDEANRRQREGR